VRIVLRGSWGETSFRDAARTRLRRIENEVYRDFMKKTIARMLVSTGPGTRAKASTEAVWWAAGRCASQRLGNA